MVHGNGCDARRRESHDPALFTAFPSRIRSAWRVRPTGPRADQGCGQVVGRAWVQERQPGRNAARDAPARKRHEADPERRVDRTPGNRDRTLHIRDTRRPARPRVGRQPALLLPFPLGRRETASSTHPPDRPPPNNFRPFLRSLPYAYDLRCIARNAVFRRSARSLAGAVYHEPNYILKPYRRSDDRQLPRPVASAFPGTPPGGARPLPGPQPGKIVCARRPASSRSAISSGAKCWTRSPSIPRRGYGAGRRR